MVPVAEVLQPRQHFVGRVHEIGQQHDQPAALHALGELVQHRAELRAALRLAARERREQHVRCRRTERARARASASEEEQ